MLDGSDDRVVLDAMGYRQSLESAWRALDLDSHQIGRISSVMTLRRGSEARGTK